MEISRTAVVTLAGVLLLASPSARAAAQAVHPDDRSVTVGELVLRDGSRMYGTVERETDTTIVFRTTSGAVITAPRDEVVSLRKVTGSVRNGEFLREDPNTTRLFFGPTGRALPKGRAYLGVYEFVLPFVQVGVTDRFSIGGGTPLIFTSEDWDRPFWITPKVEVYRSRDTHAAAGAFMGFGAGGYGGIAYGVVTRERAAGSFTVGAGMAYNSEGGRAPVVMAGADGRVSRHLKVITENYVWEGGRGMLSAGVRFFGEQLSADLALAAPIGADEFIVFPVVNFVYVF